MRRSPYTPGVLVAAAGDYRRAMARKSAAEAAARHAECAARQGEFDARTAEHEAIRPFRTAVAHLDSLNAAERSHPLHALIAARLTA